MTRFYHTDGFPAGASPAFRRFWLKFSRPIIEAGEELRQGVDDDDRMYDLMLLYAGEEAASEALYLRRKARLNQHQ